MQPRLVALLALAFVLYVVASVGAAGVPLTPGLLALAGVAVGSALSPLWLLRAHDREGAREADSARVASLGTVLALALSAHLSGLAHALMGELLAALVLPLLGVLVLRLALTVPDLPPGLSRRVPLAPLSLLLACVGALLGLIAALPPFALAGRVLIAPHLWSLGPIASALVCLGLAVLVRAARRRLGSDARALAANLWGSIGTVSGALALAAAALVHGRGGADERVHALLALAAALGLVGHASMVAPARVRVASATARELLAGLLALLASGALVAALASWLGAAPIALTVPLVIAFVLLRARLRPVVRRLLAPHGGLLLDAIVEVRAAVPGAPDHAELAARVLRPLRRAASLPEATPRLYSQDPARLSLLDAAGIARVSEHALAAPITRQLERQLGEPLVRSALDTLLPRRPELVAVARALDELDALCVAPLVFEGELEGALVVARGARRDPLTLEELLALERLTSELSPLASGLLALERARLRGDTILAERSELSLRSEEQARQLDELRSQTTAVKAALGLPLPERDPVQYSPAMRALVARLEHAAPHDVPVLLWGETGLSLSPLAQALHRASGRASEPLVIVDALSLESEQALAHLFGVGKGAGERPGLLALIGHGTLLVADLPALSPAVQRALAEVLEERRASPHGSSASYAFTGRIVLTARGPLDALVEAGSLVPELARWLERTSFRVPPLRERPEDLESLLLLSLDRAARALGKPAKGVEADALKALLAYDWPGNDVELTSVIERAVTRAGGARLALHDLPPLPVAATAIASGSYVEQEREIFRRALRHAGGDRTRAARALGLKRTILVEKLRRLDVDDPTSAEN